MAFNGFSPEERAWLASQKLGRLATVSPDRCGGERACHVLRAFRRHDRHRRDANGRHQEVPQRAGGIACRVRRRCRRHHQWMAPDLPRDPWYCRGARPTRRHRAMGSRPRSSASIPIGSSRSTCRHDTRQRAFDPAGRRHDLRRQRPAAVRGRRADRRATASKLWSRRATMGSPARRVAHRARRAHRDARAGRRPRPHLVHRMSPT